MYPCGKFSDEIFSFPMTSSCEMCRMLRPDLKLNVPLTLTVRFALLVPDR